jgi:hypothetical protein
MRKGEIKIGEVYIAKVSGKLTHVKVDSIDTVKKYGRKHGLDGKRPSVEATVYRVTNLKTGRHVTFRSAAKFRLPALPPLAKGATDDMALRSCYGSEDVQPKSFGSLQSYQDHLDSRPEHTAYDRRKDFEAGGNENGYN